MSSAVVTDSETSLQPLRLDLDVQLEQSSAHLRLAAAGVAAVAGLWLAWVEHAVWLRLTAVFSVLFAMRWIFQVRKTAGLTRDASMHFLEVSTQRITVANGAKRHEVPLRDVARIELDEDRLNVVLRLVDGSELPIEPVYGRLGMRELGETLQRYLAGATTRHS